MLKLMHKTELPKQLSAKIGYFSSPIAILIIGNVELAEPIKEYISNQIKILPQDCYNLSPSQEGKSEVITIKQSRELIHWLNLTPQGKFKLAFVHRADLMTAESANALLKIIEELPRYAILILLSSKGQVLPTIKSRCRVVALESKMNLAENHQKYIQAFLKNNFARQSRSLDEIIKSNKINDFLIFLEDWVRKQLLVTFDEKYVNLAAEIFKLRCRLKANANPRLGLENLILKFRTINSK